MSGVWRRLLGLGERTYVLRIPREEETEHVLMLGDSGTGKTQIIHRFLYQIAARRPAEAAIVYDPACEFVAAHFNARRGDVVLNPLDVRFPFWSPSFEITQPTDRQLVAESFFPGRDEPKGSSGHFFTGASRDIFARMLEFDPTPREMVEVMADAGRIDELVEGTEHAHYVDRNAGNQRGGVLASLAAVAKTLRLLPARAECRAELSLTEWARARRGWIFITSTKDTREALRPLHAAFLDILTKRLMSCAPGWGLTHPCWEIIDEVHSLKRLPSHYDGLVEGRKYGLKIVQGTQGKSEYEAYYGPQSKTMLAAAHLKIFLRTNEAESAKWVAEMIGDEEREKPKIGTTASVADAGRDSINYSTVTDRRPVFSREQIMGLKNMNGFWKHEDKVVAFRLPKLHVRQIARAYIPSQRVETGSLSLPSASTVPTVREPGAAGAHGGRKVHARRRDQETADEMQEPRGAREVAEPPPAENGASSTTPERLAAAVTPGVTHEERNEEIGHVF